MDHVEYDQNEDGWQHGLSIISEDGVNAVGIRAYDVAGNMSSESLELKVDTIAPVVTPVVPLPDGLNDWFITAPIAVSATGSDSGSGLTRAEVSLDGGAWQSDASLPDGVYAVAFRSTDNAGNSTTASRMVKVDTVAPILSTSIFGTAGNNGWYVSQTLTTISARDETSGVDRIEYNQNVVGWEAGTSVDSQDGINDIDMRAYDKAGNVSTESLQVKVDTVKPTSQFTSPVQGSTNTLVRDTYSLAGSSSDTMSSVSSAEISLDGKMWLPLVISPDDKWTYEWNTFNWPDGIYPIVVRSTDVAGNTELTESGAHVTLLVNNAPPHIKLTPGWFIWQSGTLVIKTEYFPVRNGTIVISDKKQRWPSVKIPFGEKYPAEIKWDRRFANGILAPSGDYRVTVLACNVHDLCSEKLAVIKIPWYAVVLPTPVVPTALVDVQQKPELEIKDPDATIVQPTAQPSVNIQEPIVVQPVQPIRSLLPLIVLIALLWAISSSVLADGRPVAINAIVKTITMQKYKGELKNE